MLRQFFPISGRFLPILLLLVSIGCVREPEPAFLDWLVVLNKGDHNAVVLDPASGAVKATMAMGVSPHEAAGSSAQATVVGTNYGSIENPGFSLTALDLRRFRVARTIPLGRFRRPHGIQYFKDGNRVAVTAEDGDSLLVVDVSQGRVLKAIPTMEKVSHMVALSPDETRAYVTNIQRGTLSVLDLVGSRMLKKISIGKGAEGLDPSPDGKELWIANRAEDTVAVVDTETLEVVEKLECGEFPIRVRFLPDGSKVMVSNARSGDLAVFSARDRRLETRVPMELSAVERENRLLDFELSPVPIGIVTDPEGSRVFVANSNADIVTVIDTQTWKIVNRLQTGKEPDGMVYLRLSNGEPKR
jgi:YVTN family beta-propeller protein